jgi:hypothetical protein
MQPFRRKLTKNDVGDSGNQAGFFVPKAQARSGFFPMLDLASRDNPRSRLTVVDEASGRKFELNFIYYNKKNDEFRVTAVKNLFELHGLRAGDLITLRREGDVWYFKCEHDLGDREVDFLINPQLAKPGGQGYSGSAEDRRAVELHAMRKAREWLKAERFTEIKDYSAMEPFDFLAFRGRKAWKVEVKGTTAIRGDDILMTSNEVQLHRAEKGATVIVIVSGIELDRSGKKPIASGGVTWGDVGWDIDSWSIKSKAYRVSRVR